MPGDHIQQRHAIPRELIEALEQPQSFHGTDWRVLPKAPDPVAVELAALRAEVAALRADLLPSPSSILTGAAVAAAWRDLHTK